MCEEPGRQSWHGHPDSSFCDCWHALLCEKVVETLARRSTELCRNIERKLGWLLREVQKHKNRRSGSFVITDIAEHRLAYGVGSDQ